MPDIFLDLQRIDFVSDQNASVSAWRAHADTLFTTETRWYRSQFGRLLLHTVNGRWIENPTGN